MYIHIREQENDSLFHDDVGIIADVALKFINHFGVHVFWDLIFEPKSITYSIR